MSFFRSLNTNNPTGGAFGRLRTAGTGQRLDCEFTYCKKPDLFDEVTNNGTVTLNGGGRDLTLSLADANNGSYAAMSSHPVPYTPGNSQLIEMTGVLDLAALGGGTAYTFVRSKVSGSVVETTYAQSNWINAISGVDWTDSHIFGIDFQSLKVGRIRFFLVQSGVAVIVKEVVNDNIRNTGYWQLASLPVYWKLYTTGGNTYMECGYGNDDNALGFRYVVTASASATMKAICATVKSEGGIHLQELSGLPRTADRGQTVKSVSTTLIPILSIRATSTFMTYDNMGIGLPKSFTISASNPVRIAIIHGAALTGASWSAVNTHSIMEYDISATALTGGHKLFGTYITTVANNRADSEQGLLGKAVLWYRRGTETGILTIAAIRTGGTDADCLAALNWEEIF